MMNILIKVYRTSDFSSTTISVFSEGFEMPVKCRLCDNNAVLKRPKNGHKLCRECFYSSFEEEIHQTIVENKLFNRGDTVAIGASGGKDSTVCILF